MPDALRHALAAALRNRRCECHTRDKWPWKREELCERCKALQAYELAVAEQSIIQRPRVHQNCASCSCPDDGGSDE